MAELVRVAGAGWIIEDTLMEAKQQVGFDEYEVRLWASWYRPITLALLVHAFLAATRLYVTSTDAIGGGKCAGTHTRDGARAVRRLLCRLLWQRPPER